MTLLITPKSLVGLKKGHGHSIQDRIFHGAMRDAAAGRLTEARREQWQKAGVATGHTAAVVRRNIQRGEAAAKARASGIMDHQLIIVGGQPRVLTPDGRELRQSALDAMFGRRNLDHWKTSKEKKVWPLGYYLNAHPRKLPDGAYGTWRGFTVEPKQGDWSLYRALLLEMVEGSEDNLRWLPNWMAHAVQLPGEPAGQCVVMASPTKWIGKSEAGYYFRSLFGPHAIEVGPARNILGKFNYLLHNKVVVQVDEDALTRNIGTLKHILTARTIKVERKGLEPEIVPNCLHLWATTNELAVAPDDSRRFACFECGTSYAANIAAFRAIEAQLQSGGYAALLYDLKQWDCLILDPPATSLRADSLRSGPEWEWWDSVQAMVQDAETVVPSSLLDGWRKVVRVGGLPQMSRWLNAHQDVTHFTKERIRTGSRDEVRWVFGGSDGDDLF